MHDALVPDAISQAMTFKGDRLPRPFSSIPSRSPPAFGIEGSTPLQNFTILLIESDMTFVETFSDSVSEYGFDVDHHVSFSSVKKSLQNTGARLVAIGSVSQTPDNFSICREIRQINPDIPIIWLQSGDDEFDQALMIELGADVRMSRSAHLRVVIAQLKSLRRRHERDSAPNTDAQEQRQRITHGRLQISVASLQLFVDGQPIPLTAGLFTILMCMVNRANEVVPRKDLIRADRSTFSRAIDSQMNRLRNCLGKAGLPLDVIRSARGQGYIFVSEQCNLQPRNGLKPCMPQYAPA